jgi:hypothetical protein
MTTLTIITIVAGGAILAVIGHGAYLSLRWASDESLYRHEDDWLEANVPDSDPEK